MTASPVPAPRVNSILDIVRGLKAPAWLVGIARGVVEAAVMGGLVTAIDGIQSGALPAEAAPFAAIAIIVLRSLEGVADHIDPAKQRAVTGA